MTLPEHRLPLKAYKMLYSLHCNNKNNWVSKVCFTLYQYGFGHVWENQGVTCINGFLLEFKQRLIDCFHQDWNSEVSGERFSFYTSFKSLPGLPQAIFQIKNIAVRKTLLRFRLGVSPLKTHKYRHIARSMESLHCPFCKNIPESEIHFLLVCPKYCEVREKYLPRKFFSRPTAFATTLLMASDKHCRVLAWYIFEAFKKRQTEIQNLIKH